MPSINASTKPILAYGGITVTHGQKCPNCSFIGCPKRVVQHISQAHKGIPLLKPLPVQIQTLNAGHHAARQFVVNVPSTLSPSVSSAAHSQSALPPQASGISTDPWSAIQMSALGATFDWSNYEGKADPNYRLISPLLTHTKWHMLLESVEAQYIPSVCAQVTYPVASEFPKLADAILHYFKQATNLLDHTDELVAQMLNSPEPNKQINHTPLHRLHQTDSLQKYCSPVTRLISALLRKSGPVTLPRSEPLDQALKLLRDNLGTSIDEILIPLHAVFLVLWTTSWPSTPGRVASDPTMVCLALMCLKQSGEFSHAKDVTGPIAKLSRAIQLAMTYELHKAVDSSLDIHESQMNAFHQVGKYVQEQQHTTFGSLRRLQHFVSSLAYNSLSMPQILWEDMDNWTALRYKGDLITLDHIREVVHSTQKQATHIWTKEILMGLEVPFDYGPLADDLTNKTAGYSFLDDERNDLQKYSHALSEAFFRDERVRKHFLILDTTGSITLNPVTVRKWLFSLSKLEGCLLVCDHLCGGGPARGTEITSSLARNTRFRARNLYGLGAIVATVRQYTKTSHLSGSDKLIPNGLESFTADFLLRLHALARPFAAFLSSRMCPNDPYIVFNYRHMLFMDNLREFDGDRLSDLLVQYSKPVLGWGFKVGSWRHIFIAFNRKINPHSQSLVDAEEQDTVGTLQAGHSRAIENQHYGLSPDSELCSEDLLILYIQNSFSLQKAIGFVPGGLGLKYWEATVDKFQELCSSGIIRHQSTPNGQNVTGIAEAAATDILASLRQDFQRSELKQEKFHQSILGKMEFLATTLSSVCQELKELKSSRAFGASDCIPVLSSSCQNHTTHEHVAVSAHIHTPPAVSTAISNMPKSSLPPLSPHSKKRPHAASQPSKLDSFPDQPSLRPEKRPRLMDFSDSESFMASRAHSPIAQPDPSTIIPAHDNPSHEDNNMMIEAEENDDQDSQDFDIDDDDYIPFEPPQDDALRILQRLLKNPKAQWTCEEQRAGVAALLNHQQDVVLALRTGLGKSAIAVIPSCIEQGITVIVVPLKALLEDWKRKLAQMDIHYEHFVGAADPTLKGNAKIILVSSDVAKGSYWKTAITGLSRHRTIVRYVIDEVHLYLVDPSFRENAFQNAFQLRILPCQFVLITATFPPSSLSHFKDQFCLLDPIVIRTPSFRPEIKYDIVQPVGSLKYVPLLKKKLDEFRTTGFLNSSDRYLVYVTSLQAGEGAAKCLGVEFYHADSHKKSITAERQQEILDNWISGKYQGLVTTSALSAGIHVPNIRIVAHIGTPSNAISYSQETGRAGRNGEEALALTFPWKSRRPPPSDELEKQQQASIGVPTLNNALFNVPEKKVKFPQTCTNYNMTEWLDGKPYHCLQLGCLYDKWCNACIAELHANNLIDEEGYLTDVEDFRCLFPEVDFQESPVQSLTPALPVNASTLKTELTERFSGSSANASTKTRTKGRKDQKLVEVYHSILETYGMQCGFCVVASAAGKTVAGLDHFMGAPGCLAEKGSSKIWGDIKYRICYSGAKGPCFRCHICSMGDNILHPPFQSGTATCIYPSFMLQMATGILFHSQLAQEARELLQVQNNILWDSADSADFISWLAQPVSGTEHRTGCMGLLYYLAIKMKTIRDN
ncbi:hypothetical protein VKT23_020255 [Stygiomarasmius scandens]|uniref:DNA 3'-5' helicase n=1 Tax=Marasmiellus scandens TaxID=2682957 RepID=A0ABR1IM21_9AGAR